MSAAIDDNFNPSDRAEAHFQSLAHHANLLNFHTSFTKLQYDSKNRMANLGPADMDGLLLIMLEPIGEQIVYMIDDIRGEGVDYTPFAISDQVLPAELPATHAQSIHRLFASDVGKLLIQRQLKTMNEANIFVRSQFLARSTNINQSALDSLEGMEKRMEEYRVQWPENYEEFQKKAKEHIDMFRWHYRKVIGTFSKYTTHRFSIISNNADLFCFRYCSNGDTMEQGRPS